MWFPRVSGFHVTQIWTWKSWQKKSWKTWVLDCTACISENLPADVPNNPKGLTNATVAIIGEYCKLPPNLETPTQELAFYGDMLTTRYWSPIRFFTFITLWSPICSAESILRHESLKRAAAPAIELEKKESDVAVRAAADPSHIYDCICEYSTLKTKS